MTQTVAPTGFGLVPLGGHDVWLPAVIGVVLTPGGLRGRAIPATAR